MGLLNESRREFIAAPDSSKGQIVYKWPDQNIRKFARAIVEPDAVEAVSDMLAEGGESVTLLGEVIPAAGEHRVVYNGHLDLTW